MTKVRKWTRAQAYMAFAETCDLYSKQVSYNADKGFEVSSACIIVYYYDS